MSDVTIYDLDGNAVKTSSLNAYDMIRLKTHFWNRREALVQKEHGNDEQVEEESTENEETVISFSSEMNLHSNSLKEIAESVLGTADVSAYLDSLTKERLMQIGDMRYNIKMKPNDPKRNMINTILEYEVLREAGQLEPES